MNICVFCSSSNAVDQEFNIQAASLGQYIATGGHTLVYGGANVGLMETMAMAVKQAKGKVIGVIPQKIHDKELSSSHPDSLVITKTMAERKQKMHDISDAFIALPGGFGTLEEILEVITLKQLDYHRKPIVFINTLNFFGNLLDQFEHSFETNFAKESYRSLYKVLKTPEETMQYIENYEYTNLGTKWFNVPEK